MVVDTSAMIAIVRGEEDARELSFKLAHASEKPRVPSVSVVEAGLVLSKQEYGHFLELLRRADAEVVDFSPAMAFAAVEAARKYGKGRSKSKAQLNFGDCCCYAAAKVLRMPLLYKGNDFVHTDIEFAE